MELFLKWAISSRVPSDVTILLLYFCYGYWLYIESRINWYSPRKQTTAPSVECFSGRIHDVKVYASVISIFPLKMLFEGKLSMKKMLSKWKETELYTPLHLKPNF